MKELKLDLDSAFLHDIQLIDTQMVALHCDVKKIETDEKNIKTNISICTQGNAVNDHEGESVIEVNIESRIFDMSITQMGKFRKNGTVSISVDNFESFLATQGIRLLWSFVRENVYEISCKMIRQPIMLPTLDVMKTLKKHTIDIREEANEDRIEKA